MNTTIITENTVIEHKNEVEPKNDFQIWMVKNGYYRLNKNPLQWMYKGGFVSDKRLSNQLNKWKNILVHG